MRSSKCFPAVLAGFFVVLALSASAQDWANISSGLFESIEDYDDSIPGARGVGGVVADRHTGDLYAGLNGEPFGIYRSKDGGKTWERIDGGEIVGAWGRSGAMQIDQDRPGRMAFFRSGPPCPGKSTSGYTTDGGETWKILGKPFGFAGIEGWHHGCADWSDEEPVNIVAQNRVRPQVQFSSDGGETFTKLINGVKGVVDMSYTFVWVKEHDPAKWKRIQSRLANGYGLYDGAILLGRHDGIERAEDGTGSFEKVSDLVVTANTPVRFDEKLYWGGAEGVLVSEDAGKTWAVLGAEIPMIRQGPFIGENASQMVVVTESGIFKTTDGAASWKKIADLKIDETMWRPEIYDPWTRHSYAWDHTRDLLYVAGLAGSLYQKSIE